MDKTWVMVVCFWLGGLFIGFSIGLESNEECQQLTTHKTVGDK